MRINKYVAQAVGLSRRAADQAIADGRVSVDGQSALLGAEVEEGSIVELDHQPLVLKATKTTIMLNKPAGYVVSRKGQGSKTIYELLPPEYHYLKPVGRLDKESSGLLLLTDDGELANRLTHPRYAKTKVYEIKLDKPLEPLHQQIINEHGIQLDDGNSKLFLERISDDSKQWRVTMSEGRNRQIRRTFAAIGYKVTVLSRTDFGPYKLQGLQQGRIKAIIDNNG